MFYVYAIKSLVKNYIYVGLTNMVDRRVSEHNKGKNRSTKAYIPFKLIYFETFTTREGARKKEIYYKSGVGKEFLKNINALTKVEK